MAYWFLVAGLVLLFLGSEAVVHGGAGLSRAIGLSPLAIGLFVISAGTSAPEFVVALQAALTGSPDVALGSVVGSNIVNLLLILGLAALIRPLPSSPKIVLRDGGTMLVASLALALIAWDGVISRREGLILLGVFVVYLVTTFFTDWRRSAEHSVPCARAVARLEGEGPSAAAGLFLLLFGCVGLALGAHFTVGGAVALAHEFHWSEAFVGLTVVALGASLPELVVTIVAVARGRTQIAIGHLIGANIFNILGALGATAAMRHLTISHALMTDILIMAGISALLLPLLARGWKLSRPMGALLVLSYMGYLVFLAWRQGLVTPAMVGLS
jgi:cation:H+ antiporter